jgi:hypothetical protein
MNIGCSPKTLDNIFERLTYPWTAGLPRPFVHSLIIWMDFCFEVFFYEHLYIKANVVSVCVCVRRRHSQIAARAAVAGGRASCHDLLYIQCGCAMQFGAKRCAQWARWGWTGHDGRAKPAWAARTEPAATPQASNTLIYMHYGQARCQFA